MPLAIGDAVWSGAITAIVAVMLAWMNHRAKRASDAAEVAAKAADRAATAAATKVEEVKEALAETTAETAETLADIARVGHDTHTLVNSNMAVQLRLNKVMAVRLAGLSKGTADEADDAAAAKLATAALEEHEAKQRVVDSETKTPSV